MGDLECVRGELGGHQPGIGLATPGAGKISLKPTADMTLIGTNWLWKSIRFRPLKPAVLSGVS